MYVETIERETVNRRWNTPSKKRVDIYRCDECGKNHETSHKASHATSGALTFCSQACNKKARSTGKLAQKWKKTKLDRYGVEFSSQVTGASEKMLVTRLEKFGTTVPIHHHEEISSKWKQTMKSRYGAEHPLKAIGPKAKRKETVIEKFGADPLALSENRTHLVEAGQKGYHALIQKHGSVMLSKPEMMLVEWLQLRYGNDNIEQQTKVDHGGKKPWLVDAYIKPLGIYVELDGEFWHGLDKQYDQLHQNGKDAYDRDREQDQWFLSHNMKLVRITDKEFLAAQKSKNFSDIVSKLGG